MNTPDFIVDSILLDMEAYGLTPRGSGHCVEPCQACEDGLLEIARDMADSIWVKLHQRLALDIKHSMEIASENHLRWISELELVDQATLPGFRGAVAPWT